eukprot:scpid38243/ scgid1530/ Neutrophil cytosol factor 2; 67 kDa neutrophil oxidase factor; NADPH oxidase activator 2; Neutrophil NADPH oxidase factor 2; p67-phox
MDYKTISHQWDLAVQYWQAGRYEQSYECFDAIEDPPMAIVFNVAVLQMMHEEYDIAHENFSIILARDPQFAIAYFLRGIVAYHRELYGRARDDFERCLRSMDSRHFISYRPLGMSAVLTEYQVQANLGMICTLLDGESGKGLSHMVNAKSKQDVMLKDDEFKKELSDIGQPLDVSISIVSVGKLPNALITYSHNPCTAEIIPLHHTLTTSYSDYMYDPHKPQSFSTDILYAIRFLTLAAYHAQYS